MAVAVRRALVLLSVLVLGAVVAAVFLVPSAPPPLLPPQPTEYGELRIAVSVARGGARRAQSDGVANAVRLALEERSGRVASGNAEYLVTLDVLDSAGADGAWSEEREIANARTAADDPRVVAYIGPSTLAGARAVAPVAARAGLAVISPIITDPALTKRGFDDAVHNATHPDGARVFARVVPSDDVQAAALVAWLKATGRVPVTAVSDGSSLGQESTRVFTAAARNAAVDVTSAGAKFVYVGAAAPTRAADQVRAVRSQSPGATPGGNELLLSPEFLDRAKAAASGTIATFAGRPPDRYLGAAGEFGRAYRDRFGGAPDPYAIFGYEAARLALDAVRRAGGDRSKVRDAVFATKDLRGALGTWGIDANGDTTYATTQLYLARELPDGSVAWAWDREITTGR